MALNVEEWNDELQALTRRWLVWRGTPFPRGWAGVNIDGCELVLVDSEMAMLVRSAVEKGPLKRSSAIELERLRVELSRALPAIAGEAATYFHELMEMAGAAIKLSDEAVEQ